MIYNVQRFFRKISFESAIRALLFFLIGLALLTPLIFSSDVIHGFVTARQFAFRVIVELLFALYIIVLIRDRKYMPRWSLLTFGILMLYFFMVLSSLLSNTFLYSFWGNLIRMNGLLAWGHYILFYIVVTHTIKFFRYWQALLQVILFSLVTTALIALSQVIGQPVFDILTPGSPVTGVSGNPAFLAGYLAIGLALAVFMLFDKKIKDLSVLMWLFVATDVAIVINFLLHQFVWGGESFFVRLLHSIIVLILFIVLQLYAIGYVYRARFYRFRVFVGLSIALIFSALLLTHATIAIIAVLLGAAGTFLCMRRDHLVIKRYRSISDVAMIAAVIFFIFLSLAFFEGTYRGTRLPQLSDVTTIVDSSAVSSRLSVWRSGVQAFRDKPFFGYGVNNFDIAFERHYPTGLYQERDSRLWFDQAHNSIIQYAVEGGIFTLATFVFILYIVFRKIYRWSQRAENVTLSYILSVTLCMYVFISLFYIETFEMRLLLFFLFAMIDERSFQSQNGKLHSRSKVILSLYNLFAKPFIFPALILIGAISFAYNFNIRHVISYFQLEQVAKIVIDDNYAMSDSEVEYFDNLVRNIPSLGKNEWRERFSQYIRYYVLRNGAGASQKIVEVGELNLLKNIEKRPEDMRQRFTLASYYIEAGFHNEIFWRKGLEFSADMLQRAPERVQIYYFIGRFNTLLGNFDASTSAMRKAMDQRPRVVDAYIRYYEELRLQGRSEDADTFYQTELEPALAMFGKASDYGLLGRSVPGSIDE